MAVGDWLRPPRHLVILFLGIALILVSALAWLGWRLFQQDRALEGQRVQVRREHAADVVAAEMGSRLRSIDERLTRLAALPAHDLPDSARRLLLGFSSNTLVLVVSGDDLAADPGGRLLYFPTAAPARDAETRRFARGEELEFRRRDLAGATSAYAEAARGADPAVRAGALLRLARVERKAGRLESALDTYDSLASLRSSSVEGLPADLVARDARLAVLEGLNRREEARRGAAALRADLLAGRWRLTRSQFDFHLDEACRRADCAVDSVAAGLSDLRALASGVAWVWERRRTLGADGRELLWREDRPVLVLWHGAGARTVALVGGPGHLAEDWVGALEPTLRDGRLVVALRDVRGDLVAGSPDSVPRDWTTRTAAETRLPWTLQVASADPGVEFGELAQRRRLMLLGLATLSLLVGVGLVAVVRGVNRELEAARLKSDFVAAVSHEFRTPLTSLRQLAELLSSGRVASDERRARYYDVMARESGRLHRLVEGLLDFGRMEAGALEFSWERVDVCHLVGSVVAEFEAEGAESGCHVAMTAGADVPAVRADPEALGRAVWNLLDNAVKYSPERKAAWVEVAYDDGQVRIAVRDEGVGIPTAQRDAVFRKFVRGVSADGCGVKGTGIGLAMVKHIVEAHGGEVTVESEPGRGSTFTILLPTGA